MHLQLAPPSPENRRRQAALRKRHEKAWLAPLKRFGVRRFEFSGGFPVHAWWTAARFAREGEALVTAAPTLTRFTFIEASNETHALGATAALEQVRELNMCSCGTCPISAELEAFVHSPHLRQLEALSLHNDRLTPRNLRALTLSASLSNLRTLDLSQNELIGSRGVRELATPRAARALPALRELDLSQTNLGKVGLKALLAGELGRRLTRLVVKGNPVSTAVAALTAGLKIECVSA